MRLLLIVFSLVLSLNLFASFSSVPILSVEDISIVDFGSHPMYGVVTFLYSFCIDEGSSGWIYRILCTLTVKGQQPILR